MLRLDFRSYEIYKLGWCLGVWVFIFLLFDCGMVYIVSFGKGIVERGL